MVVEVEQRYRKFREGRLGLSEGKLSHRNCTVPGLRDVGYCRRLSPVAFLRTGSLWGLPAIQ